MKTTFLLAGLLAYSLGSEGPSLESAVAEAASQNPAETRSNSRWFSSWWSTTPVPANTESTIKTEEKTETTEVSTAQPITSETPARATSSWADYIPLGRYWWSTTAEEAKTETAEKSETVDNKKLIIRHKRGEVDKSLQSQKDSLEAFFSNGNFKISPNAERMLRVRSMISSARRETSQQFGSFAEQAAFRARMVMGERLHDADLVAEHRISQVAEDSMAEELRLARKKQKRKNKLELFHQAIQAGKKGDVMSDLQMALKARRLAYDMQYSTEGSNALPASDTTETSEIVVEKPKISSKKCIPKVNIEKGKVPTPPKMKKTITSAGTKNIPKSKKASSNSKMKPNANEDSDSPSKDQKDSSASLMAELKSRIGRRNKDDKKDKK